MAVARTSEELARTRRFEVLVLPHMTSGQKLARRLTNRPENAEDVFQEACMRAYRFIDACRADNPKSWFLTIVRNAAYSRFRDHRQEESVESQDAAEQSYALETLAEPDTPESILLAKERKQLRQRAARTLSPPHREILALREDLDLSYSEIAERIGIPTGTVMSRLARARAALERRQSATPSLVRLCA